MTDPDPDLDPDPVEQANVAAAAIAGFTLAQFAFGELIKNGILPRGDAEQLQKPFRMDRLLGGGRCSRCGREDEHKREREL